MDGWHEGNCEDAGIPVGAPLTKPLHFSFVRQIRDSDFEFRIKQGWRVLKRLDF